MAERNSPLHASCSICTQIYIKPAVLQCGHTFCEDCLTKWLHMRRVCPHCRKKVAKRYKPIVLSGWEDHLETLALQLPEEDQEERRATKRLRQDNGEKTISTKRRRRENAEVEILNIAATEGGENVPGFFHNQLDSEAVDDLEDDFVEAADDPDWEELEPDGYEEGSYSVADNNLYVSPTLHMYANSQFTHVYYLRSMTDTLNNIAQQVLTNPTNIYQTHQDRTNQLDFEEDEDDS